MTVSTNLPTRRIAIALGALALFSIGVAPSQADAQAFPSRPIIGVVPFDAGGPSDIISRIVAQGMAKDLGQPIVIENKPGAGGNIGMGQVAKSKPDGYTILLCSVATTQNPAVFRNMPYDPLKELVAVQIVGESPSLLAVSTKNIKAQTLSEFLELLRKNPGKYNIAGAGGQRMTMEKFMLTFDVKMEVINYRSGGEAATSLMKGEADLQINNATTLAAGVQDGTIRVLAVAGDQRLQALPNIPTTKEAGFPQYTDRAYVGVYVPAGLPPEVLARLNLAATRSMAMPDVDQRLRSFDYVAAPRTQKEADDFYRSEVIRWKEVAQKANIPPVD